MHWILQSNLFNETAYGVLLDTLERFGLPHSIHRVVPFVGEIDPPVELETTNVICMGSYSLRHAARKHGWTPGVFDLGPYDFTVQLEHWGSHMLNADSRVSAFKDAAVDKAAFVRPIHDSKAFAGKVFDPDEFHDWQGKVCALGTSDRSSLDRETLVQVCPIKAIYNEYRFWIVRGEIVCASLYKQGDRVYYTDDVPPVYFDFARAMIAQWQPHDAFVLDVCSVPDDGDGWLGIKIVEINTLNSAGFYAANIPKLVMALEDGFGF